MKKLITILLAALFGVNSFAQDLHFSQYYNSPLLLNAANTGLLEVNDWRAGLQYRNQSGTIPVPYNTFTFFADCGLMRNKWENSWLGTGLAMWRDVAGNGNLALTKVQGNLAAHVMGENMSFSIGMSAAYSQRSVDFSKLTYDVQWDEFSFNSNLPNKETNTTQKTAYLDLGTGVLFTFFNNNNLYGKASLAVQHINRPKETFYGNQNKIGLRPIGNIELIFKASDKIMLTPSVYFTTQKKAMELVGGSLVNINTAEDASIKASELILGFFYRNKDAIIAKGGYQFGNSRVMVSYDHTVSQLAEGNNGMGAFEVSLILQGNYKNTDVTNRTLGCPRF
ncbi:MAG: PorP/SprF family type IX secretion system membrane protein [Chitinophagaceae bacterium]|nr:PorP/SprF family type IX secretion system membrane protein [Chitinophagaceae bacterium]